MANYDKLLNRILRGASDANIAFEDLHRLLKRLGFAERIRGDPHIFSKDGVEEIFEFATKMCASQSLSGEAGARSYREASIGRRQQ